MTTNYEKQLKKICEFAGFIAGLLIEYDVGKNKK